jgi:hypothetical protein
MIPLLALFADAADAAPLAAALDATRATITVNATGAAEGTSYPLERSGSSASTLRGSGNVAASFFPWTPLFDDASPRSLQSFLQRTSYIELEAGGGYSSSTYSAAAGGGSYSQESVPASVSTRLFFAPDFALLASAGGSYAHSHYESAVGYFTTEDIWVPSGSVGLDARSGDTSLNLQWQATAAGERVQSSGTPAGAPGFFPARFSLTGRAVVDHRYDVTATLAIIPDGVDARGAFGWYPTKDLGLTLAVEGEHGQIYVSSSTDYDTIYGGPAVSYWIGARANVSLSYTPQWVNWTQGNEWEQAVTLGFSGRLP